MVLIIKNLLAYCLELFQDVISFIFCGVQLLLYFIDFIVYIIIKLFIELILNILRQIIIEILLSILNSYLTRYLLLILHLHRIVTHPELVLRLLGGIIHTQAWWLHAKGPKRSLVALIWESLHVDHSWEHLHSIEVCLHVWYRRDLNTISVIIVIDGTNIHASKLIDIDLG